MTTGPRQAHRRPVASGRRESNAFAAAEVRPLSRPLPGPDDRARARRGAEGDGEVIATEKFCRAPELEVLVADAHGSACHGCTHATARSLIAEFRHLGGGR